MMHCGAFALGAFMDVHVSFMVRGRRQRGQSGIEKRPVTAAVSSNRPSGGGDEWPAVVHVPWCALVPPAAVVLLPKSAGKKSPVLHSDCKQTQELLQTLLR